MLDRDESALHAVQLSIDGRALLDSPDLVLRRHPRPPGASREVFAGAGPQVVFHAAALKHLPLLEQHPAEAVKTNVWGTLDLLELAAAAGVERFVNISTDKAADPVQRARLLQAHHRAAHRHFAVAAATAPTSACASATCSAAGARCSRPSSPRSSAGGPVTVTDPDVTRYFMTVEEAVQLVIQAGAIGRDGEALVLDMGEPVRIADVARLLAARVRAARSTIVLHRAAPGREAARGAARPRTRSTSAPPTR